MELKLKIAQGILLTQEQVEELATIMIEPDQGWNTDENFKTTHIEMHEFHGDYGIYTCRINRSWEMITLLELK